MNNSKYEEVNYDKPLRIPWSFSQVKATTTNSLNSLPLMAWSQISEAEHHMANSHSRPYGVISRPRKVHQVYRGKPPTQMYNYLESIIMFSVQPPLLHTRHPGARVEQISGDEPCVSRVGSRKTCWGVSGAGGHV